MEVLVLFPTRFFAVADAFAGALDSQDVSLVAPLALANKRTPRVLILVREALAWRAHLHNDDDLVKLVIADIQRRPYKGLKRGAWELNSGIFLTLLLLIATYLRHEKKKSTKLMIRRIY